MAYTTQQLNDLDAAIALGVLEVGTGPNRVKYRDLDEMMRIRGIMAQSISGGGRKRKRVFYPKCNP